MVHTPCSGVGANQDPGIDASDDAAQALPLEHLPDPPENECKNSGSQSEDDSADELYILPVLYPPSRSPTRNGAKLMSTTRGHAASTSKNTGSAQGPL